MNDRSDGETCIASSLKDRFYFFTIGKLDFTTRGKNHQLRNKMPGDLLFFTKQVLLEFPDPGKLLAICRDATGIDGRTLFICLAPTEKGKTAAAVGPVPGSKSTDRVKTLQGKSWRINLTVTPVAGIRIPMCCQYLANRRLAPGVRLNRSNGWRGRQRWRSQDTRQNEIATCDR